MGVVDQVTNEAFRQLIEDNGFYSLERPGDFTHIEDVTYVTAMRHAVGGSNDIPGRMKGQFAIFNVPMPSPATISYIFKSIVVGYFRSNTHFSPLVVEASAMLGTYSFRLYDRLKAKLLPTPAKFYYTFNLNDLSTILQGVMSAVPDVVDSKPALLRLWVHECRRVMSDKLNDRTDKVFFEKALKDSIRDVEHIDLEELTPQLMYSDWLRNDDEDDDEFDENDELIVKPMPYDVVGSISAVESRVLFVLSEYNETQSAASRVQPVLFDSMLRQLIKITRVLRTPKGNALLVGASGKRTVSRLAAIVLRYAYFEPKITKSYSQSDFFDELKAMFNTVIQKRSNVVLVLADEDVKDEMFLEYMNMFLMSGEVYSYGLCSYGLYSYGLYSYGLHSYGLHSYGLYSYGLYSYGLYSYGPI